jgi:hypothetical protein
MDNAVLMQVSHASCHVAHILQGGWFMMHRCQVDKQRCNTMLMSFAWPEAYIIYGCRDGNTRLIHEYELI